jgi:sporulation protein YlmC with PRC-barrel domain
METNQVDYVSRDTYGMYKQKNGGPGPVLMGADTLLGNDVYNSADEKLGSIKEFMIEMATGKINYAVLSYGGFLGMGDRLFAVPWRALKLDTLNHRFSLDVSKEKLKNAPGFDKDHWPSMADRSWATDVHTFYGVSSPPLS